MFRQCEGRVGGCAGRNYEAQLKPVSAFLLFEGGGGSNSAAHLKSRQQLPGFQFLLFLWCDCEILCRVAFGGREHGV